MKTLITIIYIFGVLAFLAGSALIILTATKVIDKWFPESVIPRKELIMTGGVLIFVSVLFTGFIWKLRKGPIFNEDERIKKMP